MTNKNNDLGLSKGLLWLETLHACCHRKSVLRATPQVSERTGGSLHADCLCHLPLRSVHAAYVALIYVSGGYN